VLADFCRCQHGIRGNKSSAPGAEAAAQSEKLKIAVLTAGNERIADGLVTALH
jgi:hypothetical protein